MSKYLACLSFLFLTVFANSQSSEDGKDARWVVNMDIQNMGGETYLRSIKTLYTERSTQMDGRSVKWITKEMLPNNGAFQILFKDKIVYED